MRLTKKQLVKLAALLLGLLLVVVAIFNLYDLNKASINNELVNLDLLPKPEKLTELYFNNSADLPDSATRIQTVNFAFVIHNLETTNYQYIFDVYVNANGTRQIIDSGNVLVKNNQYYVKKEQFNLINSSGNQEVVIELINKQQSIDFWIGK
jgi:hypothetical protein